MSNLYSIGQMNEHADALERNGWTPADVKKASGGNLLAHLLPLVRAFGEVAAPTQHIIDCDTKPFEPSGLTVAPESEQLPNRVRGQFVFDQKVKLYLSPNQQNGKVIKGTELMKELGSEPVLPANILDFYLAHTDLISAEWKGKFVFFWGTIYLGSTSGHLYVRYLCFDDSGWHSRYRWLDFDWGGGRPAALRAS